MSKTGESIPDRSLSFSEYSSMRLTTAERAEITRKLSDDALAKVVRDLVLPNIIVWRRGECATTYEEALATVYAPELIRRLESACGNDMT